MLTFRQHRLSQHLQQEIAMIIHRELKDPRLGFVTITRIELSSDLRHAKIGYSCLGDEEARQRSQQALEHGTGFIRGLVKKRLRLKIIPELVFRYDETIQQALEIAAKLDQLKAEHVPSPSPRHT